MNYYLAVISGYSLFIPGVISIFRMHSVMPAYYPFILFIVTGCLNETLSSILVANGHFTTVNNNIYVLLESLILVFFLQKTKRPEASLSLCVPLMVTCILFWTLETFLLKSIYITSSYFRIYYSFLVVLLSISNINKIVVTETDHLLNNPLFLICICFITYYTLKVIIEAFLLYGIKYSDLVLSNIYNILIYVNLLINLIYTIVLLWIPRKQFSLLKL